MSAVSKSNKYETS